MKHATLAVFLIVYAAHSAHLCKLTRQVISNITGIITDSNQNMSDNVQFILYTRQNREDGQQIFLNNDDSIIVSNFNASLMTKFVIHGWNNNRTSPVNMLVKKAFLDQNDYNVIVVDWGKIANKIYPVAVSQLNDVAKYVGKMIIYLENNGLLDLKNLTIVGHSLGAHVVGLAARSVNQTISKSVLHIVGLDPANPGFEVLARNLRIRSQDADQVEIVHTNTGLNGVFEPIGDLDFYPNGYSSKQPGCGVDIIGSCSHGRSYRYYAEALTRPSQWIAVKCASFIEFLTNRCSGNELASFPLWTANFTRPKGTYVLVTNSTSPYGLGLKGVESQTYFNIIPKISLPL